MQSNFKIGEVYIFGITGCTGTGKSYVTGKFSELGATIIDVDKVGHEVLQNEAYNDVVAHFGEGILHNNAIDRKKLGQIVFAQASRLKELNRIVHPFITEKVYKTVAHDIWRYKVRANNFGVNKPHIIVVDAALLFELKLHNICDYIVLVQASVSTRKRRIIMRDNITQAHAQARINSQLDLACANPRNKVHVVLQND